jgi:hypothetical protein
VPGWFIQLTVLSFHDAASGIASSVRPTSPDVV